MPRFFAPKLKAFSLEYRTAKPVNKKHFETLHALHALHVLRQRDQDGRSMEYSSTMAMISTPE